jgi:hypothetical protein
MSNTLTRSLSIASASGSHARSSTHRNERTVPYLGAALPVGLVGAASVAIFVLVLDVLAGRPLATPNALGAVLFRGEAFSLDAAIRPAIVFGYTLLHGAAFVTVAAAAVSAEYTLTKNRVSLPIQLVSGIFGLFLGLQGLFVVLTVLLGISWVGELGFERILVGNLIAAFSMALTVYLRGEGRREARARTDAA